MKEVREVRIGMWMAAAVIGLLALWMLGNNCVAGERGEEWPVALERCSQILCGTKRAGTAVMPWDGCATDAERAMYAEKRLYYEKGSVPISPNEGSVWSMKMNSDYANKTIKNLQAEIDSLLQAEEVNKTYSYGVTEKPVIPEYDFLATQAKLDALRKRIAVLRHAINQFNITTKIQDADLTVDEALGRMSMLNGEKKRLYALMQIPEKTRTRTYGSREADFVCRNFDLAEVQGEYNRVCEELMQIQQAINVANLTIFFDVENAPPFSVNPA